VVPKMRALQRLSVPYSEQDIKDAPATLADKTEQDALIAYLQGLGILIKTRN
jgi:cytochrome c oxidase cbb3-type subunit 2